MFRGASKFRTLKILSQTIYETTTRALMLLKLNLL